MTSRTRATGAAALAVTAAMAMTGCRAALPPTDPGTPAAFTVDQIATIPGAAFTVAGELNGDKATQEIVTSAFTFSFGPFGPVPQPGRVAITTKDASGWTTTPLVAATDGIVSPNKPTIADVNGDGRSDVIVPSGYFFNALLATAVPTLRTGSITWWENTGTGYVRHDVITGQTGAYKSAVLVDIDADGKKDIVSTLEDGGHPAWPFNGSPLAPVVGTYFFKGTGGGAFNAPVKLYDGGGSLPVVADVNLDGKLDIATAQYFKTKTAPIPPFGIGNESFVWFERTGSVSDGLDATDFTKHVIATGLGESFQIIGVDNIDGNGKYGAIGVNHTNPNLPGGAAQPQVVRLTPGTDVRAPWTVSAVADGFTMDAIGAGQASPGYTTDGDLDGDGDVDLATAGDADWSIYWIERKADGSWAKHDVAAEAGLPTTTNWGQASTLVTDLDRDGRNEIVFSSYNANGLFVTTRTAGTGGSFPAVPRVADPLLRY